MKKLYLVSLVIIFIFLNLFVQDYKNLNLYANNNPISIKSDIIKDKLIRFHVIANSNSEEDQNLKLKVRDEVIKYISPILKKSKSIDESREILKKENQNIIKIAKACIENQGYSYSVDSKLGMANFPVKNYGNITLPQGEYEAYRIIIGEGKGENWWCVMFPPLCFIDVTKGKVELEKTENQMKKVLTKEELEAVTIDSKNKEKEKKSVNFKFKISEILNKK